MQRSSATAGHAADSHGPHSHGAGAGASWSEAGSSIGPGAVGEMRQPFHLLQHATTHAAPPRLKASRKQFASPHASIMNTDAAEAPSPVSPPPSTAAALLQDSLATELRRQRSPGAEQDEEEGGDRSSVAKAPPRERAPNGDDAPSPPPVPVVEATSSSAASSARLSNSPWPASEAFTARLRNIIETRQQIEALVRKQRQDEEEMVQAIASLDDAAAHARETPQRYEGVVDRAAYEQLLVERTAAFAALRQFKEKGNVIVHRLYATVKAQQEQQLELIATVEALTKANRRLKDAVGGGAGAAGCAAAPAAAVNAEGSSVSDLPDTVPELQQKVATQRRVIEQMDQLMQNADRMLLAMRARVEAAERRGSRGAQERRTLPPLPLTPSAGASATSSPRSAGGHSSGTAAVATSDAVAAIDRLAERYASDADVATVATQQQLLLERIAELRQALKQEQAQRLHLEEVYGATSEETARNVALLEERLQRAQGSRGAAYAESAGGGGSAASTSVLQTELHAHANDNSGSSAAAAGAAAAAASVADNDAASMPEVKVQRAANGTHTASHATSRSSSASTTASSNPSRNLFTAISVGDGATQTVQAAAAAGDSEGEDVDVDGEAEAPQQGAATANTVRGNASGGAVDSSPLPRDTAATGSATRQPRAYLGRSRSATNEAGGGVVGIKAKLGIPVPDPANLGASVHRSVNSRSSSASRRLVDFRPATAADATSRGLDSASDNDVDVDEEAAAPVRGQPITSSSTPLRTTQTPTTIVPTAIHSPSSPLPDASTTVNRSAARQQRLQQQMEELEKMEAEMAA